MAVWSRVSNKRFGFEWDDAPGVSADRARWAAEHPKRFLAATTAVGTVDRALLAAIRVKHAHMLGAALVRHLLIVDEVHAPDRYREALLGALLPNHPEAGGHAAAAVRDAGRRDPRPAAGNALPRSDAPVRDGSGADRPH